MSDDSVGGKTYDAIVRELDWMRLDRDAHQRVAMRAMERADRLEAACRHEHGGKNDEPECPICEALRAPSGGTE